jgi:branched-chain amino acid transport system substrate-binding protein
MKKLVLVLFIVALLAPLALAQSVKLAFMGPLTGGAAFIGQEALGFSKVVVEAFNARTGMNVEVVEGDDEINPDTGKIVAERLASDSDVLVVVGPMGSQVCESVMSTFEGAGLAYITPSCTRTDLTDPGSDVFFRPIPNDASQSKTIADYWLNTLAVTSAFMLDDQSSYAVGLNDEVENLLLDGGIDSSAITRTSVTQDETDFSSVATAAIASGAAIVFFPNQVASQGAGLAIALDQQGYDGILFMPDGGFNVEWVATAGAAAEGTYVTFFAPDPNQVATMKPYNDAYVTEVGGEFGAFGGATALATYVALNAVESCKDDLTRACIVTALDNTNLETTPLGVPVSFGEGNQTNNDNFFLFQVQDGKFVLLQ